jgi:hypothetical protein
MLAAARALPPQASLTQRFSIAMGTEEISSQARLLCARPGRCQTYRVVPGRDARLGAPSCEAKVPAFTVPGPDG